MPDIDRSLSKIFDGWDGYNASIVHAVEPLTPDQLAWRPAPHLRAAGEIASHLAFGRVDWFSKMPAPLSLDLLSQLPSPEEQAAAASDKALILHWLGASWAMIDAALRSWTVEDLKRVYHHEYWGRTYAVSFQWTVWRILTHDVHHGGELALVLGMQHIEVPELGDLFGHLTVPPFVD